MRLSLRSAVKSQRFRIGLGAESKVECAFEAVPLALSDF